MPCLVKAVVCFLTLVCYSSMADEISPLPACFAALPKESVVEIAAAPSGGARLVADPEALKAANLSPYAVGLSIPARGLKFPARKIAAIDVVPDAFHVYRIGQTEEWTAYAALKFEGPRFSDRSKSKTSRVCFSRAILVNEAKAESSPRRGGKMPPLHRCGILPHPCPQPSTPNPQPSTLNTQLSNSNLPTGFPLPALPPDPFPDRMSAYVWRNWGLVEKARLAEVVGATADDVTRLATEMGLAADPVVEPEWKTRGFITIIRRNWHLLDYAQLLKLTGMNEREMKSVLVDHDFLFHKLGGMKPVCAPLVFRAEEEKKTRAARQEIAAMLAEEGVAVAAPCEPRFAFLKEFGEKSLWGRQGFRPNGDGTIRLMSSYFADFGDPLGDDAVGSYPEGLLARLAAENVNAIWLAIAFHQLDARRYANARKLTTRAAKYGMDVYVYLNEPRGDGKGMCTSLPETRAYLREKTRELFASVPDLRGAFTITASENPTSCASQGAKAACPRCKDRSFAEIVSEVNVCIAAGMRAANPKAELIVWDWGWDSASGEDWRTVVPAALAKLPKENVRFLTISERFIPTNRGGFPAKVNEYSISTPGPGARARTCWQAAKDLGLGTMAKVQASASWEFSAVPYVPCMDLVSEHAWNLARAGVGGVMLSWSVGAWPSPNLRLFSLARADDPSPAAALERLAAELYGPDRVAAVRAAWTAYSEGFREFPFWSCVLHRGPHHMGPANLLWSVPTGYRTTMTGVPYDDLPGWCDIYTEEIWISQMSKVRDGFAKGNLLWNDVLQKTRQDLRPGAAGCRTYVGEASCLPRYVGEASCLPRYVGEASCLPRAEREAGLFKAIELHFRSIVDQAEFIRARRRGDRDEMRRRAASELATAQEMLALVRADSRIGYECANHYFYVPQDFLEKILNCKCVLKGLK